MFYGSAEIAGLLVRAELWRRDNRDVFIVSDTEDTKIIAEGDDLKDILAVLARIPDFLRKVDL